MAIPKQKFREIVLQLLFSENLCEGDSKELATFLSPIGKITKKTIKEAYQKVQKIRKEQHRIDAIVRAESREYHFERISLVERNILRLGIYELFYDNHIPSKVVIVEAVRLCRKFGTRQSTMFINALLDSLNKKTKVETTVGN